jgi:hypothetical protein
VIYEGSKRERAAGAHKFAPRRNPGKFAPEKFGQAMGAGEYDGTLSAAFTRT